MYLKELRLHGFKSFADPTRLILEHGVTAIVGPNGCGKSNIADALRWVLGEQSAKSLRAGAMQDVIFQGTSNRKPVNLCEVSLIFTDCEELLGTAHNEVEVTRRVVRDGGSEYLLNGKSCRLKDIHNLFLDTGVGQVSYSFMLQGQIDQVLSSNPNERRAIFEEAAGISKYKAQRREALNKLAQVDANLARVTDVMEEVARQTGSLKRQAGKALRYQKIFHRLSHLDLAHHGFQYLELHRTSEEGKNKSVFLREQLEKLARELEAAESSLSSERERAISLRQRMEAAQKKVYDLRSEKENATNRAEVAELRREDHEGRIRTIKEEMKQLANEEEILAAKLAGESKLKQEQIDLFDNSDEEFKKRSSELGEIQKQLNVCETELSRHKQALLAKENAVSRLRSNCTSLELDLKTYQVRHANLTEELQILDNEHEVMEADLKSLDRAHDGRIKDRERQESKLTELKTRQQELTHAYRDLQKSIQETERQRASLQAQISVLEDLQAKFEGFSEGARAILQGKFADTVMESDLTPFLQQIKVQDGFTRAVELLLGSAADGVFVRNPSVLGPLSKALAEKKLGRASIIAQLSHDGKTASSGQKLPEGVQAAQAVVSSGDGEVREFIGSYLADCFIADDLESFLKHWREHPDFSFKQVVTRKGELVDSRGVVLAGTTQAKKEKSSFLSRQNQLKRFSRELATIEESQERMRLEAQQIQGKIDSGDKRIEEQSSLLSEITTEIATLRTQKQGLQANMGTNRRALESKKSDLQKLETGKDESTAKLVAARKDLDETEADIEATKARISESESQAGALRAQKESKREDFDEVRFEMAQKRQRLELLDRGLNDLQQRSKETEQTRIRRMEESERLERQIVELQAEVKNFAKVGTDLQINLDKVMESLEKDRSELQGVEKKIALVEEGFAPKRESQQKLSEELNKTEVALARQESRIQFIREECLRSYERDPEGIDWKLEFWKAGEVLPERIRVDIEENTPEELEAMQERPDPTDEERASIDPVDWDQIDEEIQSLRTRVQSMGPVNLVAIEEYKELKERHEFLTTQSNDLWKAKEELLQAIDEINTTSQSLFADTFEKIRKNFLYTFDSLFGGGRADLKLVDAEDVLESGIEITAQPPGTRLRNLGLLSGGQKTMTAVALLFAIYMVKPSPFCVLDEIDAPLDDANIGRFTKMLEEFLEFSQFLIITHNKRTISVADTIYGTTMQEKGVSRMVSMKFNKATGQVEE